MTDRVTEGNLRVARVLYDFVNNEALPGTGIDPDGIPNNGDEIAARYINDTSPYVDQNQAYGSHEAITDLLEAAAEKVRQA